jgi:hypothetical protein
MGLGSNLNTPDWSMDIEECYPLEAGIHEQIAEKRSFSQISTVVPYVQITSET